MAADADVTPEAVALLRAVGFDTRFALEEPEAPVTSDTAMLIWARNDRRILVCHDKHSDRQTKLELYPELHRGGGHIIEVGGDSSQLATLVLAKLLMHEQKWKRFFRRGNGIVRLLETAVEIRTAESLYSSIQWRFKLNPTPKRKTETDAEPPPPRKRRRSPRQSERLFTLEDLQVGEA